MRKGLTAVAATAGLALALGACGDDDGGDNGEVKTSTATPTTEIATTPTTETTTVETPTTPTATTPTTDTNPTQAQKGVDPEELESEIPAEVDGWTRKSVRPERNQGSAEAAFRVNYDKSGEEMVVSLYAYDDAAAAAADRKKTADGLEKQLGKPIGDGPYRIGGDEVGQFVQFRGKGLEGIVYDNENLSVTIVGPPRDTQSFAQSFPF